MHMFNMPSEHYINLLSSERKNKFTKVPINSFFGRKTSAIYLRVSPIEDIPLFISSPGYKTKLSTFYPIYMGEIVMIGYLIVNKMKDSEFIVSDTTVIVRNKLVVNDTYKKGFCSKQIVMLESESANLFIPSVKYDAPKY